MSVESERLAYWRQQILNEGFVVIPSVFSSKELDELTNRLDAVMSHHEAAEGPIRDRTGTVYAGRNLLSLFEPARTLWRRSPLLELLTEMLGTNVGLVRGLYFDKPPERTWSLPWHKDMTLAVRDHSVVSPSFSKPTMKAGVPHVEGSLEVLGACLGNRANRIFLNVRSRSVWFLDRFGFWIGLVSGSVWFLDRFGFWIGLVSGSVWFLDRFGFWIGLVSGSGWFLDRVGWQGGWL